MAYKDADGNDVDGNGRAIPRSPDGTRPTVSKREAFEKWWDSRMTPLAEALRTTPRQYAQNAWEAGWQARAAEMEKPSPCGVGGHTTADWVPYTHDAKYPAGCSVSTHGYCRLCRAKQKGRDEALEQAEKIAWRYNIGQCAEEARMIADEIHRLRGAK